MADSRYRQYQRRIKEAVDPVKQASYQAALDGDIDEAERRAEEAGTAHYMLLGGAKGGFLDVVQRAVELGARPYPILFNYPYVKNNPEIYNYLSCVMRDKPWLKGNFRSGMNEN